MSSTTLLPRNATAPERAIEDATARLADVPVPLRTLWNPATCPAPLLPWLAWALSIDAWKSYWPDHIKRARVAAAIDIQRRKGTAQSVRSVIAAFGGAVQLREWFQLDPPGVPHTFDVCATVADIADPALSAALVDDIIGEISRTKPARSHFTFTQGVQTRADLAVAAVIRPAVYRRLRLQAA